MSDVALEAPVPLGVEEKTGALLPPLDLSALQRMSAPHRVEPNDSEVLQRGLPRAADRLSTADVDPNNLADAGWGVIFSSKTDPAVREALMPLVQHRTEQVRSKELIRIFDGRFGYQPGDTAQRWLARFGVGLSVVDPIRGVPLYLTIVGPPDQIPFEFQYLLDAYWNVGRLAFDEPEQYSDYARRVIDYEKAATPRQGRRVAIFAPKHPSDLAMALFHDLVARPLCEGDNFTKPVGERQNFQLTSLLGERATKRNFADLLRGRIDGGPPAVLLSGSHGDFLDIGETAQRERMGAIVCQEWSGGPIQRDMTFAAEDLEGQGDLGGLVHILFGCYGGGCPEFDEFRSGTSPRQIAKRPFVARLPQKELLSGALAVLAQIDRTWSCSLVSGRSAPQRQEFRDLLVRIMKGERVGQATDSFNLRWAVLSAELAEAEHMRSIGSQVSDLVLANRWVARNDARNYVLFGDPAVRLNVESMT